LVWIVALFCIWFGGPGKSGHAESEDPDQTADYDLPHYLSLGVAKNVKTLNPAYL
jgi:hypothetical protein